jgi:hypothetical protein
MTVSSAIRQTIAQHRWVWLSMVLGFAFLYYALQLTDVVIAIGHWPNYITFYNYPANVLRIIRSTPDVRDMLPIIGNEWLVETGYMTHAYGHGIAEWSLEILPARLVLVLLLGALSATSALLLHGMRGVCRCFDGALGAAATGLGALSAGIANVTMTWVACCASPSWVVGLTLLGLGTPTAYALLPYGELLSAAGFVLVGGTTVFLARRRAAAARGLPPSRPPRALQVPGRP